MILKSFFLIGLAVCVVHGNKPVTFWDNWNQGTVSLFSSNYYNKRAGSSTDSHSCDTIRGVPRALTFITRYNFYRKYTEAYGIPIIGSAAVSDRALRRACHIARFLFADRKDLREGFYKNFGRFGVIGLREHTTTIPEFSHLPSWWNTRARGLGGVLGRPISTGGEENILCMREDRYHGDDIFFHEASHGVAEVAMAGGLPHLYTKLKRLYNQAKYAGKWRNTYAMTDSREYFAEGMQSYFNNHIEGPNPPNGVHGHINTRAELKAYDPGLYNLIAELYPCGNTYLWCKENAAGRNLKINCDGTSPQTTTTTTTTTLVPPPVPTTETPNECENKNRYCDGWARYGYCKTNKYVQLYCKKACGTCASR